MALAIYNFVGKPLTDVQRRRIPNPFLPISTNPLLGREAKMREWFRNVFVTVWTVAYGMWITLRTWFKTYNRQTFTEVYEYPEVPVPVKPRYRGFHRFDLTTCIACDKCAVACPVDCIYIEKEKSPVGKGFRVDTYAIDYTKCMFCALV